METQEFKKKIEIFWNPTVPKIEKIRCFYPFDVDGLDDNDNDDALDKVLGLLCIRSDDDDALDKVLVILGVGPDDDEDDLDAIPTEREKKK